MDAKPPGLFVTGTGTGVGKTYVSCRIAEALVATGRRVGVYKPVESGVAPTDQLDGRTDAGLLWAAAGRPGDGARVCPQSFEAAIAPHLAARDEAREVDAALLRSGIEYWRERSEFVLVEGAGGLMSPLTEDDYVADLALDLGYPLLIVAPNVLGVINQTLQTLVTAATFRDGLNVAGVVLNACSGGDDPSTGSNRAQLEARCVPPILAELGWGAQEFDAGVDWYGAGK